MIEWGIRCKMNPDSPQIYATLSDERCETAFIQALIENGVTALRLNTAHQSPEITQSMIKIIRSAAPGCTIMLDTKGPELRTRGLDRSLHVRKGEIVMISPKLGVSSTFSVTYDGFIEDVPIDTCVLLDDGLVELKVIGKQPQQLVCKVKNDGIIRNRCSVNVPEVAMNLPVLTKTDRDYLELAVAEKIDFIAHSFVRNRDDVLMLQELLKPHSRIKLIAKIENRSGLHHFTEIAAAADGILIARGDLGVEIPAERVPFAQKQIIKECRSMRKPVIVSTHFLHSMIHHPCPTRAEVNDVVNTVLDGASAILLTGETAQGKYPVETVQMLRKIILAVGMEVNNWRLFD